MPATTVSPDDAIDLQMHTIYSDGRWAPDDLFDHVHAAGFRVVAVTDHDRLDKVGEMVARGAERGIHVIPAVEVTTDWNGHMTHLLCYAPAFQGSALAALTERTRALQLDNTRAVHQELLRQGYTFPRQAEVLHEQGGALFRPVDNARLLQAHGHASTLPAAMEMIRAAGFRSIEADLAEAVEAAHASGAFALISHPGRREQGFTLYDLALLDTLAAEIPLDGLEVRHPSHTLQQVEEFERYVHEHGWLQSAGSDSHGPHQRMPIAYPAVVARDLLERCGIRIAG